METGMCLLLYWENEVRGTTSFPERAGDEVVKGTGDGVGDWDVSGIRKPLHKLVELYWHIPLELIPVSLVPSD